MINNDKIRGGKADRVTPKDIAKKFNVSIVKVNNELEKGTKIELEHTDNESLAHEIALDHLTEFPDYYTRLTTMEKKADKDWDVSEGIEPLYRALK